MLNISVENADQRVIVHCQGRLVLGHETRLLCAAIRQTSRELVVDLQQVTGIDAAGIGALISLQAAGFYLTLLDPSPGVREVMVHTSLDSVFEIAETGRFDGRLSSATMNSVMPY